MYFPIERIQLLINDTEWGVVYLGNDKNLINLSKEEIIREIGIILAISNQNNFKLELEISGHYFTVGIDNDKNEILLGSRRLSRELILSKWMQFNEEVLDSESMSFIDRLTAFSPYLAPSVIQRVTAKHNLENLSDDKYFKFNEEVATLAKELASDMKSYKASVFEKISDWGLQLTANYKLVRIHLLKFLAILPSLDHDKKGGEVKRIFLETLDRLHVDSEKSRKRKLQGEDGPLPNRYEKFIFITYWISSYIPRFILAAILRELVKQMAKRFIAGVSIEKASKSLKDLNSSGRDATLDQLGELVVSKVEADNYMNHVLDIIKGMKQHYPVGEKNLAGILRAHVSIKVSALSHDFKPHAFEHTYNDVSSRLRKILITAMNEQVFINIDAEHYHYRDLVLQIYEKVLLETNELKDYQQTGIVLQAYLRDCYQHFCEINKLAKKRNLLMPIRLVKGAYWDAETVEAWAHNFNPPQFLNKEETDIHFRQIVIETLKAKDSLQLVVASHNILDHSYAYKVRETFHADSPVIEHQCLHMTYEALSHTLAAKGWPTRNYIPIGNLLVGMAYLVRRIMENSSQVGILSIMRSHNKLSTAEPSKLMLHKRESQEFSLDPALLDLSSHFKNIYPLRTYINLHHKKFLNVFNGFKLNESPEDSTIDEVDNSLNELSKSFKEQSEWSSNLTLRTRVLITLADLLLYNREKLTAIIIHESSKTYLEAMADVDEAIDFVNFYIRAQVDLNIKEKNIFPVGVISVIAPWNFPLAIPVGMTVSALSAGNHVLLKPAEQTPIIIQEFKDICYEAGVPQEVFQVAYGDGEIGARISSSEVIDGLVFTGSKQVGVNLYNQLRPQLKNVITEMGGKNAVIITNNCELDETVSGILYSAFAHAGQKCSACSRVIIDRQIKDSFMERFLTAAKDLNVGLSTNFETDVNPLISKNEKQRVLGIVKEIKEECTKYGGILHLDRSECNNQEAIVGPVVAELPSGAVLNNNTYASKEIFAPVVHIIAFDSLDEAIALFNCTEYALTGGIYCQSQTDIDYLIPKINAGNIYINRPNTGARVAIEPFGGFYMSGTGPKAGSSEYLNAFNQYQHITSSNYLVEEGSAYFPGLMFGCKRDIFYRKNKLAKFRELFLGKFELLLGKLDHVLKNDVEEFFSTLLTSGISFYTEKKNNLLTPGQLNYDIRDFGIGNIVIYTESNDLQLRNLRYVLTNLLIGNGVLLVTRNTKMYVFWKGVVDLLIGSGFKINQIEVIHADDSIISKLAKENLIAMYFDSSKERTLKLLKELYAIKPKNLIKIYTNEACDINNFEDEFNLFIHRRSMAVNTMRHGAPLELEV